jgi:hypothetical protein
MSVPTKLRSKSERDEQVVPGDIHTFSGTGH